MLPGHVNIFRNRHQTYTLSQERTVQTGRETDSTNMNACATILTTPSGARVPGTTWAGKAYQIILDHITNIYSPQIILPVL